MPAAPDCQQGMPPLLNQGCARAVSGLRTEVAKMSGELPVEQNIFHPGTLPDVVNNHVAHGVVSPFDRRRHQSFQEVLAGDRRICRRLVRRKRSCEDGRQRNHRNGPGSIDAHGRQNNTFRFSRKAAPSGPRAALHCEVEDSCFLSKHFARLVGARLRIGFGCGPAALRHQLVWYFHSCSTPGLRQFPFRFRYLDSGPEMNAKCGCGARGGGESSARHDTWLEKEYHHTFQTGENLSGEPHRENLYEERVRVGFFRDGFEGSRVFADWFWAAGHLAWTVEGGPPFRCE